MSMSMDCAMATQTMAKPTQSPSGRSARSLLEDAAAEAAPRQDGLWGQAGALELDSEAADTSSGETSPIGMSLLYQKRLRQRETALHAVNTAVAQDLENDLENLQVETSPIGKGLLDRKRHHANVRMARERRELTDATSSLNEPITVGY